MEFLAAVFGILLVCITVKYILYRRQIRDICRQMQFLRESGGRLNIRLKGTEKEMKELAEQIDALREQQNMREIEMLGKDRQLKETLANVSHDIRTPLTSLKGYFRLFQTEEDTRKKQEYLSIMQERMDTLSVLLEELFTYTRLQDTNYELDLSRQDMTPIVLKTLFSFYGECRKRQLDMDVQVEEKPLVALCNEGAVGRVISNILRNALLHGSGRMELVYGAAGEQIQFVCRNSVDAETKKDMDISQVFERFYKADKARSKSSTGLGLAIAKELVERMNGTIEASYEDEMFAVRICIPLVKSGETQQGNHLTVVD